MPETRRNILFIYRRPDTKALFENSIPPGGHGLEFLHFESAFRANLSKGRYHLIFAEADFSDPRQTTLVQNLRGAFLTAYVVFVILSFNKNWIEQSYIDGDGAIELPLEPEPLGRIIDWYLSAESMRRIDLMKAENEEGIFRRWIGALRENKIALFLTTAGCILVGTLIALAMTTTKTARDLTSELLIKQFMRFYNE